VFQRGPEVHGDGTDLDLGLDLLLAVGKKHRHGHDQVKAPIAVRLRVLDVVSGTDQLDVVLGYQQTCDLIDVGDVGADHPDAGDIRQVLSGGFHAQRQAAAQQLVGNALGGLDPCHDQVDGVAVLRALELVIEVLELRGDLAHGGLVEVLGRQERLNGGNHPLRQDVRRDPLKDIAYVGSLDVGQVVPLPREEPLVPRSCSVGRGGASAIRAEGPAPPKHRGCVPKEDCTLLLRPRKQQRPDRTTRSAWPGGSGLTQGGVDDRRIRHGEGKGQRGNLGHRHFSLPVPGRSCAFPGETPGTQTSRAAPQPIDRSCSRRPSRARRLRHASRAARQS